MPPKRLLHVVPKQTKGHHFLGLTWCKKFFITDFDMFIIKHVNNSSRHQETNFCLQHQDDNIKKSQH